MVQIAVKLSGRWFKLTFGLSNSLYTLRGLSVCTKTSQNASNGPKASNASTSTQLLVNL